MSRLRLLVGFLSIVLLLAAIGAALFYSRMKASLPVLDGTVSTPALSAEIKIERDHLGVPTITAKNRLDAAVGLGFLHGQERFFQMDLARRRAAGELSALFGKKAINADKRVRMHAFRPLAQQVLASLPKEQTTLLEAYASGVNQGLQSLKSPGFEYMVLRAKPQPWKPEDSILMIYAMTLDLQEDRANYEQSLACVRDVLGSAAVGYFAPLIGPDDAAIDGSLAPLSPMPTARQINLRALPAHPQHDEALLEKLRDDTVLPGSNSFALSGERTANHGALLANDMHLTLRLPNIWYRASLVFPDAVSGEQLRVVGVTLPGTPLVVAGSNGHVAWGFTNSDTDSSDLVVIDPSSIDPSVYMRGKDLLTIEKRRDTIEVKGDDPVTVEYEWTVFGPVVGQNAQGRRLAMKWTMDDPQAANYALVDMESAKTLEDAIAVAHRSGIPAQNIVLADQTGRIAWTICGKLPKRVGFDGRLPTTWTYGDRRWEGFLSEAEIPVVIAPSSGQLWTANNRVIDREDLIRLGDGGYERPQRAARIRDLLTPLQNAKPRDLLNIQLDTGAPYLNRWHELLGKILDEKAVAEKSERGKMKQALQPWAARADADSVSYRLVRRFRQHVVERVFPSLFERCIDVYTDFSYRRFHIEEALWDMVQKQPAHLLAADYNSWNDLLLAAVDDVLDELKRDHLPIERANWGRLNTARIMHPLGRVNGLIGKWLSMPEDMLSGDYDTPRVQAPDDGASERLVVSPGHEDEGIFEMPGGQSGHPLSPYFSAGHEAWVRGEPTPFLPGKTEHTLVLTPAEASTR
ncbi:MAG TPA: penicillin acylase family protein [Opitutaceae bacterium]|nr:penicillin acylase family protein [Opitutaceae bacterium]